MTDKPFHLAIGIGLCGFFIIFIPVTLSWFSKGCTESFIDVIATSFLCELFIFIMLGLLVGGFIMFVKLLDYIDWYL